VYIECEHCKSGYELELPPAALAAGRSVKFRCQSCGHSFHVVKDGEAVSSSVRSARPDEASEASQPEPAKPESASIQHVLLRQDGVSYHVPDVATLQRWIVERRVLPTDELDFGGGQWVEAGKRPDLAPFFAIVDEVESVTRKLADVETGAPADLHALEPALSEPVADDDGPLSAEGDVAQDAPIESDVDESVVSEPADAVPPGVARASVADSPDAPPARVDPSEDVDSPAEADELSPADGGAPSASTEEPPVAEPVRKPYSQGVRDKMPLRPSPLFGSDAWPEIDAPSSPLSKAMVSELAVPIHDPDAPADDPKADDGGLNWADKLFEEAPLPKAQADGSVFDELDSDDETVEANRLMQEQSDFLEVGSPSGGDAGGEEAGWFAVEQGRVDDDDDEDIQFKSGSSSSGAWWFALVILFVLGVLIWQGSGSSLDVTSLQTPGGAGSGAIELATGGKPKAGSEDGDPSGDAEPSSASAADPSGSPATGDAAAPPAGTEAGTAEKPAEGAAAEKSDAAAAGPASKQPSPPKTAAAVTQRGWRAVDRKRYAEAEQHFNSALKLRAAYAPATYGLGYVAHRRGDANGAKVQFCKALSNAGSDVDLKREIEAGLRKMNASCPWGQ
jgi:hypothetical protein